MPDNRLSQIENSLRRLSQQLKNKQRTLDTIAPEEKERLRQQIADFQEHEIKPLEEEHQRLLGAASAHLQISEPEAEVVIGEIVAGVSQIEAQPIATLSADIVQLLHEIRDQLNEPDKSAAMRVKAMISTFPPFVGVFVEPELDLEKVWQQHFPTFTRLLRSVVKK